MSRLVEANHVPVKFVVCLVVCKYVSSHVKITKIQNYLCKKQNKTRFCSSLRVSLANLK